jgi:hypothetical protein
MERACGLHAYQATFLSFAFSLVRFLLARQKNPRACAYGCADEASRMQVCMVVGMSKRTARGTDDENLRINVVDLSISNSFVYLIV